MDQAGLVVASVGLSCAIGSTAEGADVACDAIDGVTDGVCDVVGGKFTRRSCNSIHCELLVAVFVTAANAESCRVTHCWTLHMAFSSSVTRSSR